MASYIREQTGDGEDLVDMVMHILHHPNGEGLAAQKLQLECIQWLADRGFGKASQLVAHTGVISHSDVLANMSVEDLQALIANGRALVAAKAQVIEGEVRAIE